MHPLMLELLPWVRQGYCCSQLLLLLLLQARGEENPALVRAMQGLCVGIGHADGPCGLLTGGACALGLLAGKGADGEEAHPLLEALLNEYALWFRERTTGFGGSSCDTVAAGLAAERGEAANPAVGPAAGRPDPAGCGDLLAEAWEKLLELAQSYDLDIMAHTGQA